MPFPDVPADHWAAASIEEAVRLGLVQGFEDGTFRPEAPLTRAHEATIEVRQARNTLAIWSWASTRLRQRVAPAVVHITRPGGLGAGFLVSATGLVVTADHVVAGASAADIGCSFPSWPGQQSAWPRLDIIRQDPKYDLALGRVVWPDLVQRRGFPFLPLALASPEPGELVVALGSPNGIAGWESMGLVARPVMAANYYQEPQELLPLSLAINPGNSGGAVIRAGTGELAGVVVMKLVDTNTEGQAFAVPVEQVWQLLIDALAAGEVLTGEVPGL